MDAPEPNPRRLLLATLCCGTALLAGCSLLRPKFERPTFAVVGITLGRSDLLQQHLVVRMRVTNPNDRELPVEGLTYTFEVNGEELARGVSNASFVIPARGEAEFDTAVTTNMASAMLRWLGRRDNTPLNYRFSGKVQLSAGFIRSVPFERTGVLDLQR